MKQVHAAVALVYNNDNQVNNYVLLAKRRDDQVYAGYWEFPGGKIELGEQPVHAITRELKEELSIDIIKPEYLGEIMHEYPEFKVFLHVFKITDYIGTVIGNEGQELRWEKLSNLPNIEPILPASFEIVKLIN